MKAQSLDSASIASVTAWSATGSRLVRGAVVPSTNASSLRCRSALSRTMSATCSPSQTRQSLPEPQDEAGSRTGPARCPASTAPRRVVTRTPASGSARSTASSHAGPSCHQCPKSSVSYAATTSERLPCRARSARSRVTTVSTKSSTCPRSVPPASAGSYGALSAGATCFPVTRAGLSPTSWSQVWKSR